jgi:putative tryptophan/tyrosine transport system substrate-binding protein
MKALALLMSLVLSLLVAPLAVEAQQPAKVPHIGVLGLVSAPERTQAWFRAALRELEYTEEQNILVEYRWAAAGQADHLEGLAAELVRLKVDIIVALNTPSAQAAMRATTEIPIVMAAGNAVETGLVASLARPGGNVTGLSGMGAELGGKCLELLRDLLPAVTHVAVLVRATSPFARLFLEQIQSAAGSIGVQIRPVVVRGDEEFDSAFAAMVKEGVGAVIVQPTLATQHAADLTVKHHLPAVSIVRTFADSGGLMSYTASTAATYRRIAVYVDRILKGAKPADLPVEQPTKFELVINLKTAEVLGLTIPPTLLFQADEVIR